MKALVYTAPEQIVVRDEPTPSLTANDALVRIHAAGICGSDMHAYHGRDERRPAPLVLGHEASGTVALASGDEQRVVINPLVVCGDCEICRAGRSNLCAERQILSMPPRAGTFAEFAAVPKRNLLPVPEQLSLAKAALAEPLATAWHAVQIARRVSGRPFAQVGEAVVLGGGAVGLGAALTLRALGCEHVSVSEPNALRRATVEAAGIESVFDPATDAPAVAGRAGIVIDAVGSKDSRRAAMDAIEPGGTIIHIGLADGVDGLDARRLTLQEVAMVGSYTYTMADFEAALAAMAAGSLGELEWFEERPLDAGPEAFEDLGKGSAAAAKILLRPGPMSESDRR